MSSVPEIVNLEYELYLDDVLIESPVIAMSVTTQLNKIPKARIELNYRLIGSRTETSAYSLQQAEGFDAPQKNEKFDFLPGKKLSIRIGYDTELEEIFVGYVVKQNIQAYNDGTIVLCVDCKHIANRMTLNKRTRFYHHSANSKGSAKQDIDPISDTDVFNQILKNEEYDLNIDLSKFNDPRIEHENMTQYDCSDWDFLIMRLEALGYVLNVEGSTIKVLKAEIKPNSEYELELGRNILEYEAEYDETTRANAVHFKGWDVQSPDAAPLDESGLVAEKESQAIQSDVYINHSGNITDAEAKAFLESEKIRQELGMVQALVKTKGTHEIQISDTIGIAGFNSVWDRDTFVSGIRHVVRGGSWYVYIQCGVSKVKHAEEYKLSAQLNGSFMLPASSGLIHGKVEAYKTGVGGEEMIEVLVPSSSNMDEVKSIYARLSTFSAGEKGGAIFRPYPGDEVVIGFIDNDPRFPVILGSLYKEAYPYQLDEDKQYEVGFSIDDWKVSIHEKDKKMTIASKNGQSLVLDDQEKSIVMAFNDQNSIKITQDGIEMDAQKISLTSQTGVELKGLEISAEADAAMKLTSNANLEMKSKGVATLNGQITQVN